MNRLPVLATTRSPAAGQDFTSRPSFRLKAAQHDRLSNTDTADAAAAGSLVTDLAVPYGAIHWVREDGGRRSLQDEPACFLRIGQASSDHMEWSIADASIARLKAYARARRSRASGPEHSNSSRSSLAMARPPCVATTKTSDGVLGNEACARRRLHASLSPYAQDECICGGWMLGRFAGHWRHDASGCATSYGPVEPELGPCAGTRVDRTGVDRKTEEYLTGARPTMATTDRGTATGGHPTLD